jgi:hypothetical protein
MHQFPVCPPLKNKGFGGHHHFNNDISDILFPPSLPQLPLKWYHLDSSGYPYEIVPASQNTWNKIYSG